MVTATYRETVTAIGRVTQHQMAASEFSKLIDRNFGPFDLYAGATVIPVIISEAWCNQLFIILHR
jgi:hypothetical protein